MILGIVGPEANRFTSATEQEARMIIRTYLQTGKYAAVTSGACHRGGVDIFAREESALMAIHIKEYPAEKLEWSAYRKRNILIAKLAHEVICITPETKVGCCKHCMKPHVSSGGCWTVNYARSIGKIGTVIVVGKESL